MKHSILHRKFTMFLLSVAALMVLDAAQARAQAWPNHPITLVMPYAAGGPTDVAVRDIAHGMEGVLGQSVVVENKPGAGATIGAQFVARAKPDGYTLLVAVVANMVTNPLIMKNLSYDPIGSFAPVSQIAANPLVLVASGASGFKTLEDVRRAAAKESKGLAIASYGYGTPSHLAIELLESKAHIKLTHVPYNGSAKATVDLLGGQVPLLMDILPSQLQNLASGKVVGIAIGQASRSELAPSIPTFEEAGVPGVTASTWFGLVAPKGTSKDVVEKLSEAVRHAAQNPQLRRNFMARGMVPQATTPEGFGKIIREDYEKWEAVIKASGIQKQ